MEQFNLSTEAFELDTQRKSDVFQQKSPPVTDGHIDTQDTTLLKKDLHIIELCEEDACR